MRGINKAIIVGHVGKDPDTRYTNDGKAITTLSVATSEQWTDKAGQKQSHTEWHRIKLFGKLAEIAGEYVRKGSQVYIEGKLKTDKYTDKEGVERYSTDIIADQLQMIGGKPDDGAKPAAKPYRKAGKPASKNADFDDDEIPFN